MIYFKSEQLMIAKYIAYNQKDAQVTDPYRWVDGKEMLLPC